MGFRDSILGFRVEGFQVPISNFGKGFSEPDFQNFDAQMSKIVSKSCFFVKNSLENQFFFTRNSQNNFVLGITTPNVHYLGDTAGRPMYGFDGDVVLDREEFRVNHHYRAINSGGRPWRRDGEEILENEVEPWMGWGHEWVKACRGRNNSCPYRDFDAV